MYMSVVLHVKTYPFKWSQIYFGSKNRQRWRWYIIMSMQTPVYCLWLHGLCVMSSPTCYKHASRYIVLYVIYSILVKPLRNEYHWNDTLQWLYIDGTYMLLRIMILYDWWIHQLTILLSMSDHASQSQSSRRKIQKGVNTEIIDYIFTVGLICCQSAHINCPKY